MNIEKLIEQLNAWNEQHLSVVCGGKHFACDYLCENEECIVVRAATAIETLRTDLARVTAERDGAVEYVRGKCKYCKHNFVCTSRKGSHRYCWEWRGIKED